MDTLGSIVELVLVDPRYTTVAVGAVLLFVLAQLPRIVDHLRHYLHFYFDHEGFWTGKTAQGVSIIPFKVPWPGTPATQYWLLNQKLSKAMFANSPALDYRDSIDYMHDTVWDLPNVNGHQATLDVDRMLARGLVKTKIGPLVATVEQNIIEDVARLRQDIGAGARVPLAHRSWSLLWNGALDALYGKPLGGSTVRRSARQFIHNSNVSYLIDLLPGPRWFWLRVLPKARAFLKGRSDLHARMKVWIQDEKAVAASDPLMQDIVKYFDENSDKCSLDVGVAWVAMLITGLAINTSEVPAWMFAFLLQSPALFETIREEVDKLPSGPVSELDLKAEAPILSSALQETMRMRGMVYSGRTVKKPFKLPGVAREFKPGELLRIMSPAASLDTEAWGDDAAAFRGDRFHEGGDSYYSLQLAFGGGATTCPGKHLATQELMLVAIHMIRNFDFSDFRLHKKLPDEGSDMELGPELPKNVGTPVKIIDLDGAVYNIYVPEMDNTGCEIPSGFLAPLQEVGVTMKPRLDVDL
ncbi:putative cytochrome p450 protein [Pseudohyphozyma bogoriensis]|nr:putative cytochrome p450 protein [Pseudohyphozyma bogoriensis]